MKEKDLIKGEIYVAPYPKQGIYIFKYGGGKKSAINTEGGEDRITHESDIRESNGFKKFEKASSEQKYWLEECMAKGRFIPKEKVLANFTHYTIY